MVFNFILGTGQIVGISATLSNMAEMAQFLGAFVYSTNFRPVLSHFLLRKKFLKD